MNTPWNPEFSVSLSLLDTERFGVVTVKAYMDRQEQWESISDLCEQHDAEFLILRCPASATESIHLLEKKGAHLMDCLLYYKKDLLKHPLQAGNKAKGIRRALPSDLNDVSRVASAAFSDYQGHYHADNRLPKEKCDAVYVDWARRLLLDEAITTYVAESEHRLVGFLSLKHHTKALSEIVLNAVMPDSQKKSVYSNLVKETLLQESETGTEQLFVSTQLTNAAVQKVWVRQGMEINNSFYTFHLWRK